MFLQWQKVRLRRLRVIDWEKAAAHFARVSTRHLVCWQFLYFSPKYLCSFSDKLYQNKTRARQFADLRVKWRYYKILMHLLRKTASVCYVLQLLTTK